MKNNKWLAWPTGLIVLFMSVFIGSPYYITKFLKIDDNYSSLAFWFTFFSLILLLASIIFTFILAYQAQKYQYEIDRKKEETEELKVKENADIIRSVRFSDYKLALERHEKVTASINSINKTIKQEQASDDVANNNQSVKESLDQTEKYITLHKQTFDELIAKLNNLTNEIKTS